MEWHSANVSDKALKNELANNLLLIEFKELVIAKINCICDEETHKLSLNNQKTLFHISKIIIQLISTFWALKNILSTCASSY